jgi:superfamily I DNA/RNA helicase
VLIDEGHDFRPEWLKLAVQMVDPATNSLLVLYDDAQSIYERSRSKQFSFKSVGIQAQGRTTILKDQLPQHAADSADGQPDRRRPAVARRQRRRRHSAGAAHPCGRAGQPPLVVRPPSLPDEAHHLAELLADAHHSGGTAWGDMAVLCRDHAVMDACAQALRAKRLPHQVRKRSGDYQPALDSIKVMTMKVSKGLEFPLVAIPGLSAMPVTGEDEK